jgi:hypothetical protein
MIYKIVSFYHKNLNSQIVELQKKVFESLKIDLVQYEFEGTHGNAINTFLDTSTWDLITLFDVDCIPTNPFFLKKIFEFVNDDTIYGNAQVSNSFPYVAPSFISFTKKFYENSPHKSFEGMMYPNENGFYVEADCGEVFVKENIRIGKKQILSYPIEVMTKKWSYQGNNEYPPFEYGNGTTFDNGIFHNFQIRHVETQDMYIKYVTKLLEKTKS